MAKQVKHESSWRDGLPSTAKPRFTEKTDDGESSVRSRLCCSLTKIANQKEVMLENLELMSQV